MDVEEFQFGAISVSLIAKDDRIVASVRAGNAFEPESRVAWAQMCAHGGNVIDVGAYTGLFAIAAAKMGCKVWAFEPMPANMQRLLQNASLNGVELEAAQCVVADKVGTMQLTYNPNVVGLTAGASLIRKKGNHITVPSVTIDSLSLDAVAAIKIDVERAETSVLAGAARTLKECRPPMIVEALGDEERTAVKAAVPSYSAAGVLDIRNMHMLPC